MTFTKDELNALGIIVSNAQITGKDAPLVTELLRKITAALEKEKESRDIELT